jgi:hypothetical protein
MKLQLESEEMAMTALAIFLSTRLTIFPAWWIYLLLFFTPDISMIGYLVNTRVGAVTYNIAHNKGVAIVLYLIGIALGNEWWQFAGLLLFAHASFDRVWGFGLKYPDNFKHTHLDGMK